MKYINTSKIEKIEINKQNTYIVIDFDRTITEKESLDSWDITASLLGEKIKKEIEALYKKYRPIEIDYNIAIEEKEKAMVEWYESCMNLYHKYNLTKDILKKSVKEGNIIFRKGIEEFLRKMHEKEIPIIILSAGIGNVIEEALKLKNSYYDNIYIIGNFIEFDENGMAKKFDNSKMIHTLNKTMDGKVPEKQLEKIKNRKYKILIGDLIEDTNMVNKAQWDTTLKIGILNNETSHLVKKYNEFFDIVLTDEDACFQEIEKILNIKHI